MINGNDITDDIMEQWKKENAELKNRDCWKSCEYANPKAELIGQHIKDVQNFTKAKEIIRDFLSVIIDYIDKEDKNYSFIVEAEQFLKENEE